MARSPLFPGEDNGIFSGTIQGQLVQNAQCLTHRDTYYFSYVTEQTTAGVLTRQHFPEPFMNPFLIPAALYMGQHAFARPFYPGFVSSEWWANDGLVSVYSQMFPRIAGHHPAGGDSTKRQRFEPGAWFHELVPSTDHVDIVAMPELWQIGEQRRFYTRLFQRLAAL
jgi:hypothetical protein